jgi:hypothetical protein
VTPQRELRITSGKVPNAHIAIAASTDKKIAPRHHGPYPHDVAFKGLLVIALDIENMYLGVVEGDDNVAVGQV